MSALDVVSEMEIALTLVDLVLVADSVIAVKVVSAVVREAAIHDISWNLVSDCLFDMILEPELTETESLGGEQLLTMMNEDVGTHADQAAILCLVVVLADLEDHVEVDLLVGSQPSDEPVDHGVMEVAVVEVHVGEVLDDRVEVCKSFGHGVLLLSKVGLQADSQRFSGIHISDPLSQKFHDTFLVLDVVGDESVAMGMHDAALVFSQGGLEILAQNECETVAGNGVVGLVMELQRDGRKSGPRLVKRKH